MNKLVFWLIMMIAVTCLYAQDFELSIGGEFIYNSHYLSYDSYQDIFNNSHDGKTDDIIGFGVWVDYTYLKLSIDYTMSVQQSKYVYEEMGGVVIIDEFYDTPEGYAHDSILFSLIFKFPFDLGFMKIAPEFGIAYNWLIYADWDGNGENDFEKWANEDLNDFFAGVGFGFLFTFDPIIIGLEALYWSNITPNATTNELSSIESVHGFIIELKFGVGFIL